MELVGWSLIIPALAAFVASGLTFFSGFGLGTMLLPVFAIFFPLDLSVAMTAIVHLLNNLFKLALVGRQADRKAVARFGLPAVLAAIAGAKFLVMASALPPVLIYPLMGRLYTVTPVGLMIAILMFAFVLLEVIPALKRIQFGPEYLAVGGFLSGFFGGLSGHQGALRSAFLVRCGLSKEAFVATGVVVACLVDFTRLGVYFTEFNRPALMEQWLPITVATLAAFTGAFTGSKALKKVTLGAIQVLVSVLLALLSVGIGAGWI